MVVFSLPSTTTSSATIKSNSCSRRPDSPRTSSSSNADDDDAKPPAFLSSSPPLLPLSPCSSTGSSSSSSSSSSSNSSSSTGTKHNEKSSCFEQQSRVVTCRDSSISVDTNANASSSSCSSTSNSVLAIINASSFACSSSSSSPTSVIPNNTSSFFSPQSLACPITAPTTTVSKKEKSACCCAGDGDGSVAMLAIDLQNDFLADDPNFYFGRWGSPIAHSRRQQLLKHIDDLARQVRSAGGIVIFVKSRYDDQTSGVNKTSSAPCCAVGTLGSELHKDAVALIKQDPDGVTDDRFVAHGDLILTKSWYSAFMGTTLHAQFQRMGIRHVVVCGVTTNHSVAATVRAAAHKGYNVWLSSEGTAQLDPKLQCVTLKVLEPFCQAILKSNMKISDMIAPSPIEPLHNQVRRPRRHKKEAEKAMMNDSHAKVLRFDGFDQLSGIGTGDSLYFPDLLPHGVAESILDALHPRSVKGSSTGAHGSSSEIDWKPLGFGDQGYHSGGSLPRLVACQACVKDGHVPIYRSADPAQTQRQNMHEEEAEKTARWTPSLDIIRTVVEDRAGHSFNWGRLLCYRDGKGDTFLQSDTCLDIVEDSFLAIFSLGQERDLELLPKKKSASLAPQRISLRHNSLLLLGPQTSRMFLQFVRDYDNGTGKMVLSPSPTTKPRISIAFRSVATMYVQDGEYPSFYGQGTEYEHFPQLQKARTYLSRRERRTGTALAAGAASLMALAAGRLDGGIIDSQQTMSSLKACAMAARTATSTFWWKESRRDHLHQQEQDRLLAQVHRECRRRSITASQARAMMMLPTWSSAKVEQASSEDSGE